MARLPLLYRREIWVDLLLYPGHTLPTAAAPVVVAAGLAVHDHVFAPVPLTLAFLGSWLIHIGGVLTDNYELLRGHPRVPEHPELLHALADGTLTFPGLKLAIAASILLGVLPGPYLFSIGGLPVLLIGIVGIAASLAYAGGPLPYARLGLADPIFFVMFGVIAVAGTYYIQAASLHGSPAIWRIAAPALPLSALVLGLPVGALVTNVMIIDDIRDRDFDRVKGWRTGAVRFGIGWSRAEYLTLSLFAYLAPLWFWLGLGLRAAVLLPLLTLPLACIIGRAVCTLAEPKELRPITPRASRLALLYAMLLALGVAFSAS
ncbi:MAG: prenyltransferase [Alphaproteobacteria bacterium]